MLIVALVLSAPFLLLGLTWGLPTRATDPYLFGDRTPWTGQQILDLAGGWDTTSTKGADVQQDDALDRTTPILLNDTDAKRADLVRRYRLYTYQPDEMINLRAFSRMKPSQLSLDPRLYQYGGLWFYPAGAVLKAASLTPLLTLRTDVAFYLDNPDQIGRMYVVLRGMTVFWALIGVAAVYGLSRQMGAAPAVAAVVAIAFASAPGVVVFSHEAKPHIPGMTLVLLSVLAAVTYVRRGGASRLALSAALAGGAFGMVVSMLPALLVPLTALWMRRTRTDVPSVGLGTGIALSIAVFLGTYAITNPYVVLHLLTDRTQLSGQISNSTAMYRVSSPLGTLGAVFYMLVSLTPAVLLTLPTLYLVMQDVQKLKQRQPGVYLPVPLLLIAPTAIVLLLILAALAAGKPGEFARFGLVIAAAGVLCAGYLSTRFRQPLAVPLVVVALHVILSVPELARYIDDSGPQTTRLVSAQRLAAIAPSELTLLIEPAPYNTPAVDLWKTQLILLPLTGTTKPTLGQPPDVDGLWKMSWAARENFYQIPTLDNRPEKGNALGVQPAR